MNKKGLNRPARILVYGMTDNMGGIEAYLMNMFRNLNKEEITFDFIVDFPEMAYSDEVVAAGSKIYKIIAKGANPVKHLLQFFKILIKHKEYKTVYFNILNAGAAFSMIIPFILGRKIVIHSHNSSDNNLRLHRTFQHLLLALPSKKLACSALAADYMFGKKNVEKGKVTIINNAIDLDKYTFNEAARKEKRAELGIEDETVIIHVGRMYPEKNPKYILDIFSEVVKIQDDAILLYAGTGPLEDELKNYAREKQLTEKNLKFLGMRKDVPQLFQAADVFLLPSLFEGLPVVGIEAQTADLPCFLSDTVSETVKIIDKLRFISINESPTVWAEQILKAEKADRRSRKDEMTAAGYNIETEVQKLVQQFC